MWDLEKHVKRHSGLRNCTNHRQKNGSERIVHTAREPLNGYQQVSGPGPPFRFTRVTARFFRGSVQSQGTRTLLVPESSPPQGADGEDGGRLGVESTRLDKTSTGLKFWISDIMYLSDTPDQVFGEPVV